MRLYNSVSDVCKLDYVTFFAEISQSSSVRAALTHLSVDLVWL